MKKYAVITFLFDDYDLLRNPLVVDENADYYCLTDDKTLKNDIWNCLYLENMDTNSLNGIQKTYMIKYSFYKYIPDNYDFFVTIDASLEIKDNLSPLIQMMTDENYDIGLSMHHYRCVWNEEYRAWVSRGVSNEEIEKFRFYSNKMGFDPNSKTGLIECTMKIYKNNGLNKLFIEEVYNTLNIMNDFKDKNDQCYFTCVLSRYINQFNPLFFTRQFYSDSKYFNMYHHKTNNRIVNTIPIEKTPNILFGKKVNIKIF